MGRKHTEKLFTLYEIISPSGRAYVGITSTAVSKRWYGHVRRARKENRNHPLCCAIRKYGPENFIVRVLSTGLSEIEAKLFEIDEIKSRLDSGHKLYNVSPGGEYDAKTGGKVFWEEIRKDPDRYAQYIKNLSEGIRANYRDYTELAATAAQWRKDNPKEAYKKSTRNLRKTGYKKNCKPPQDILAHSNCVHKRKRRQAAVKKQWADRSKDKRREVGDKISESLKNRYDANPELKEKAIEQLDKVRKNIDHVKRKTNQKVAIKQWWEDLRSDPIRYKEYIDRRKRTLKETNERKNRKDV